MVRKTEHVATPAEEPATGLKAGRLLRPTSPRVLPAPCCPSPARLHPQTGHDAGRRVSCPSRPSALVTSRRPREPHSPRRTESPGRRPCKGARFANCISSGDRLSSVGPPIGDDCNFFRRHPEARAKARLEGRTRLPRCVRRTSKPDDTGARTCRHRRFRLERGNYFEFSTLLQKFTKQSPLISMLRQEEEVIPWNTVNLAHGLNYI